MLPDLVAAAKKQSRTHDQARIDRPGYRLHARPPVTTSPPARETGVITRALRARHVASATALAVIVGLLVPGPAAVAAPTRPGGAVLDPCAEPAATTGARCLALERAPSATDRPAAPVPEGITPSQLQAVYGVSGTTAPAGTTVGIVVAFDAPDVEADLAKFRSTFGLGACTTANGCFRKVDQRGVTVPAGKSRTSKVKPVYADNWQLETTLDTQAVSAMCPSCKILLVEADTAGLTASLGPALLRADALGATVISNSFADGETGEMVTAQTRFWSQVDVPVFAASGDFGWRNLDLPPSDQAYNHATFPASSPSVISVGGTSAQVSGNTVTSETAWSDAGSGCSFSFARPAAQTAYFAALATRPDSECDVDGGGAARAVSDLSAMADVNAPGFPTYLGGQWTVAGGTSLSVQLVAALAAYAGPRPAGSSVTDVAYALAARRAATGLADITTGTNKPADFGCGGERVCTARAGWDGPTGLGTPRSPAVFKPLLTVTPTISAVGGTLRVAGTNFVPGEQIQLSAHGESLGVAVATASGGYYYDVVVPIGSDGPTPVSATGLTSGLTASVPVTVVPLAVTPATQTVTSGSAATLRLSGFGAREAVTAVADTGGTGSPVATGATADTGAATLTWTTGATGTYRVVVTGADTGRTVTVFVAVVAAGGTLAAPPTILSTAPTTAGGAVVGVRIATTGVRATSVAVVGSDGMLSPRARVSAAGDAFVAVPTLADGATVTYTAVAGTSAGDSDPSAPSLAVTGSSAPGTGDLTPVGPVRRIDSRQDGGPLGQGRQRTVQIAGTAGVPAEGVAAVVVSLTLISPTKRTYLTLWPSGETRPTVSNANSAGGGSKASLAKVKLGADGAISLYNNGGTAGFILDVVGWFAAAPTGSGRPVFAHNQSYGATTPVRVADSRGVPNSPVRGGGSIVVPIRNGVSGVATRVPADAASVELIVQSVNATTSGYVTVYPTGLAGGAPRVSNVQAGVGRPVATAVVATIGADGTVTVYAQAHTDVIVDIVGYYASSANGRFVPISPRRYYDTRVGSTTPFGQGVRRSVPIAAAAARDGSRQVPAAATAVSFSLTATNNTASTYVTAWQSGTSKPFVTTLLPNPAWGLFDNLGLAGVGAGGAIALYNNGGSVDLIVDVQGYYTAGPA